MKVLTRGTRAGLLIVSVTLSSMATSGCLVEKERNPGARAAQRAAERRRTLEQEQKAADAQGNNNAEIVKTAAIATITRTYLAMTMPKTSPKGADQMVVTLEPLVKSDFDCRTLVAKRSIDRYNGEIEITGSTSVLYGYPVETESVHAPVIYREVASLQGGAMKMDDIIFGDYRLNVELRDGGTGAVLQAGSTDVSIKASTTADAHMTLHSVGEGDQENGAEISVVDYSAMALTDNSGSTAATLSELKPYSTVCPSGRVKGKNTAGSQVAQK